MTFKKLYNYDPLLSAEKHLVDHLLKKASGTVVISEPWDANNLPRRSLLRASLIAAIIRREIEELSEPSIRFAIKGASIVGELRFDSFDINSAVHFEQCCFHGPVSMSGSSCREIMIVDSVLRSNFLADGLAVSRDLRMLRTHFHDRVSLQTVSIGGIAEFNAFSFLSSNIALTLDRADISKNLFLCGARARGRLSLVGARIAGDVNMDGILCEKPDLSLAADRMVVGGDLTAVGLVASGCVRFVNSEVSGSMVFKGAIIDNGKNLLNCESVKISGTWQWLQSSRAAIINLSGATIGHIVDDIQCWPDEILLDKCQYNGFSGHNVLTDADSRLNWLSRMKPQRHGHCFWPQPYEQCAKVLREGGSPDDARTILIEKERLQRQARRERLRHEIEASNKTYRKTDLWIRVILHKVFDAMTGWLIAYGYRPLRALWGIPYLIFIGGIIFLSAATDDVIKPNLPELQRSPEWVQCSTAIFEGRSGARARSGESQYDCYRRQPEAASVPGFDPLVFSITTLLPVIPVETARYWTLDNRYPVGSWALGYLWLHVFLGWGFTLFTIAGLTGLVKLDSTR